jgi:hypothetical protein
MAEKRLNVTELDFDDIKDNLKIFLKGQTEFVDYNFEGSGMNTLLDTLAYNTHYLAYNLNMVANEMFLDSASVRDNVVSHAKTLGYETGSVTSSLAYINVILNNVSTDTITMPAGTTFSASVDGISYQFVTIENLIKSKDGTSVTFNSVPVYEGTYTETRYVVDTADVEQRFIINNLNTDTRTLRVRVQSSVSDTAISTYTKATDITQLKSTSKVYFLQEIEGGQFEVYFGDGVLSDGLSDGNIVLIDAVICNKAAPNGAVGFISTDAISGVSSVTVTTVSSADGGGERESIDSIKLLAPLDYTAQGRCVTTNDYKVYTKKFFPQALAIQVFGGENGSYNSSTGVVATPEYGRVFISIKTNTGNSLTTTQKAQLVKELKQFNVASITPVVVDPDTTYLILQTVFKFNSNITTKSKETLVTEVSTNVSNWNADNLLDFNKPFRQSQVLGVIDNTDISILSSSINLSMAKYITPTIGKDINYSIPFNNKLYHPHDGHNKSAGGILASTGFKIAGNTTTEFFYDDDGSGVVRRYYFVGSTRTYADSSAGTIDYENGIVAISSINIGVVSDVDELPSLKIRFTAVPNSKDIIPLRQQILEIDLVNSTVVGEVDTIAVAAQGGTAAYTASGINSETKSY